MLPEHSAMSLPWTNIVAVRMHWNTDLSLPVVLSNYGNFHLRSCCHLFLHKTWWFPALQWHPKFCLYQYLTVVAESCDILSIVLPYVSLWSYACHEDLSSTSVDNTAGEIVALEAQVKSEGMHHHYSCHPTHFWACLCGYAADYRIGICRVTKGGHIEHL
jgi:hypothetical protein